MTDREFKSIIDELWLAFASSGISNPISVIEQMTYLIFFKMFEELDNLEQKRAKRAGKEFESFFKGREELKWSNFKQLAPNIMLKTYRDKVFPLLGSINAAFNEATCIITKPVIA